MLKVGADGLVDLDALAEAIEDDTVLVSIMAVNNEIGVFQPLTEIHVSRIKNILETIRTTGGAPPRLMGAAVGSASDEMFADLCARLTVPGSGSSEVRRRLGRRY